MKKRKSFTMLGVVLFTISICLSYLSSVGYAADKPIVYIAGDSTVQTYSASQAPQQGWGQRIQEFFTTDVTFVNKSIGGRSSKSFIDEGRLKDILSVIKPGDYLLCQWGINDRYKSDTNRYTDPATTFRTYLKMYIDGAKGKGATPIIITPTTRFSYSNGVFQNDFKDYCIAAKEVAAETNTKFIDLQAKALSYLNSIGYNNAKSLYMTNDVLHFNDKGAYQMARLVSEGITESNLPISKYVKGSTNPSARPTNTPTQTKPVSVFPEDINRDGAVNMSDVMLIAIRFNTTFSQSNYDRNCDLNNDGAINMSDVISIALKFNTTTANIPTPTNTQTNSTHIPTNTPMITAGGPEVDPSLKNKCTGTNPIKFHMDLQPGNYDVTVVLGENGVSSSANVVGEARRTMLGTVTTSGELTRQTFTINVRNPEGQPTGQGGTGTSGLDLTFSGTNPKLNGIGVVAAKNPIMIYLAGDSTVCDQPTAPFTSWGQIIPQYFKLGVCIANYADSGENSSSFLSNKVLFPAIMNSVKANDYVFIQLGHNDKTTSASAFKSNINSMVNQCKQKGAIPVLISPSVRRIFNSDNKTLSNTALHINGAGANMPAIMKEIATQNNIKYIDLTSKSKVLVESLGAEASKKIFLTNESGDNTHFSAYGANEMAKLMLQGMKEVDLPVISMLR